MTEPASGVEDLLGVSAQGDSPRRSHLEIVLLRPGRLRLRHLREQDKLAALLGCAPVPLVSVNPPCL
jgi:hypothetical protein